MLVNRSLAIAPAVFLFFTPLCRQFRSHARNPFPSKVSHYLHWAKIIDLIRVATRSNDQTSLESLLGNCLLDPFHCHSRLPILSVGGRGHFHLRDAQEKPKLCALATVLAKFFRRDELRSLINEVNERSYNKARVSYMGILWWSAESSDIDVTIEVWDKSKELGNA
ncbi:hypothetical protein MLD38_004637 [Melastoma candidum]|uniref:Uncharacterized protein n=1 Tax=Melastoma candidum TaxID=119954 RepID=A0ACB9S6F4_9MYRT|nr:hypothetical protein MLD38_004637 [Melastoma candidum]